MNVPVLVLLGFRGTDATDPVRHHRRLPSEPHP
jgi:hypothetical protein